MTPPRSVLIVGGGIAGLSAALRLRDTLGDAVDITVIERADRLGGKLATGEFAGSPIETGAETFLVRRPEAVRLVERVGLTDRLRHPTAVSAGLVVDGRLIDMPRGTMMGIPADATGVADVVGEASLARIAAEPDTGRPLLGPDEDISVGRLVRDRLGDEITDRLVDPLLGGVYAGRADDLSLEVAIPALAKAARTHTRLTDAVASLLPPPSTATPAPVFGTLEGGLSTLVDAVAEASAADIRLGLPVRRLERWNTGWRAEIGSTRDPYHLTADAVVLALPARPAARLLTDVDEAAAELIGELDYASLALVSLAIPGADLPERSGFLVPATEGMTIKAATFFTKKWPHLDGGNPVSILRASIGRYGENEALRRDDDALVDTTHRELARVLGNDLPRPVAASVRRWGGALPQYRSGHRERMIRARARLVGQPIALAGAAFDGVGIPACIASGEAAAELLRADRP